MSIITLEMETLVQKQGASSQTSLQTSQTDKLIDQIASEHYANAGASFKYFCKKVLKIDHEEHHEQWARLLDDHKYLLVECARDHGKSWLFAMARPLWWVRYGVERVCLISYSLEQVTELCARIKYELEHNDFFSDLTSKQDISSWTKTNMKLAGGSMIKGESFGSSLRGGHYTRIVVDDCLKDYSGMKREEQKAFFYGTILPALKPNGQLAVDGTPIDYTDLLSDIENNSRFHTAKFPAIKEDGQPLWSKRYSLERLEERRAMMGSWLFGREYLLQRQSPETAPLRVEWLKEYKTIPVNITRAMTIDPNISKEETADHSGIVIGFRDSANMVYIEKVVKRRCNPYELIELIFSLYGQYKPDIVGLETVAFQKVLQYWLYDEMQRRGVVLPLQELRTQGRTKHQRIMGLQPRMEAGHLLVSHIDDGIKHLREEILKFRLETKDNDDDALDATAMLNEVLFIPRPEKPEAKHKDLPERDRRVWTALDKRVAKLKQRHSGTAGDDRGW